MVWTLPVAPDAAMPAAEPIESAPPPSSWKVPDPETRLPAPLGSSRSRPPAATWTLPALLTRMLALGVTPVAFVILTVPVIAPVGSALPVAWAALPLYS